MENQHHRHAIQFTKVLQFAVALLASGRLIERTRPDVSGIGICKTDVSEALGY
jgi:hypothetical protein